MKTTDKAIAPGLALGATVDRSFTPAIIATHSAKCGDNGGADPGAEEV